MSQSAGQSQRSRGEQVEVAHFWSEGDGKATIESLVEQFQSRNPGVDCTVTDYTDTYDLTIKSRFLAENSPEIFAEWPGANLVPYYEAQVLRDITDVWEANDLEGQFIEGPRQKVRQDGRYVGIPIDIHRKNNLFYNVELVEERGIDPASVSDPREFLEVLEQCDDGDVIGMQQPMKNPWTVVQLYGVVMVGQFGSETYADITDGNARVHREQIEEGVRLIDEYAKLAADHSNFLGMVEANERFVDGESVFFHQGDWVAGEYGTIDGFDYGSEWDHVSFPGSRGSYHMALDAIVAANGAEGEGIDAFLQFAASDEALNTFNRAKGSIPPLRNASIGDYPRFLQDQYDDFQRASHYPGGHKSEVHPETFIELLTVFSEFIADRDVERATSAIVDAYE